MSDVKLFRSLELALQSPNLRASSEALDVLLADSFREFGSLGQIYDKRGVVEILQRETAAADVAITEVRDFAVEWLASEVVIVTYRSVGSSLGEERVVLRSSIWKQTDGKWQMLFHQGTLVPPS